jgi:16S rRNA G1207 methylase RsmC
MASLTSVHASLISSMYDFSQFNTIIDIGGGQGKFLSNILKDNPNVQGILFDLPHAIKSAKESANVKDEAYVHDIFSRCKLIEDDFFKSIPAVGG